MNNARALLPGLYWGLAGMLVAGLAVWLTLVIPLQREQRNLQTYFPAFGLIVALDQQIARLVSEVDTVARHPALLAAAKAADARQARQVLDDFSYLEGLVSSRLLTPGQARRESLHDRSLSPPLLDMIVRAERGVPPNLEAHPTNGQLHIHSVTPIRGSATGPVQAVLLMTFELQRVSAALKIDMPEIGKASLVQGVFDDPQAVLASAGESDSPAITPIGTFNDAWSLHFQPGSIFQR